MEQAPRQDVWQTDSKTNPNRKLVLVRTEDEIALFTGIEEASGHILEGSALVYFSLEETDQLIQGLQHLRQVSLSSKGT